MERPAVPSAVSTDVFPLRNPIDHFIAAEHTARGLEPRPEASKPVLLRRVYIDLIGLNPTPDEQRAFLQDSSPDAYERIVDRLLADPRYGERWGRHWMDVWRYSDWAGWSGGNQIRDSQPHIWRWRDWIVESLNADKGYDQMVVEMLAADELAPEDPSALRATGFLVRNYKMLSREQWLEDTIKHTSQAFLGLTLGCAKCHDHMYDPISQEEYYQVRAIFEPHQVRIDRIPGELDRSKDGLARAFDGATNTPTYFFNRGDERTPDTNRVMQPGVPSVLGGRFEIREVALPNSAAFPDKRAFVVEDLIRQSEEEIAKAERDKLSAGSKPSGPGEELKLPIAKAKHRALLAVLEVERLEDALPRGTEKWTNAAQKAVEAQREVKVLEARLKLVNSSQSEAEALKKLDEAKMLASAAEEEPEAAAGEAGGAGGSDRTPAREKDEKREKAVAEAERKLKAARKKREEAEKALREAEQRQTEPLTCDYEPRPMDVYPTKSTGRRLAFARWIANSQNPLTARVAVNHIWLRHFGRGLVASPANFGKNGRTPSHPDLLDWLASEFMARGWSMKELHRLIVTSSTYRMASTPSGANSAVDPDNIYLWRMNSRRLEAEAIRDNLLHAAGNLDTAMGGPEIDHNLGLKSRRRSVYLQVAAEKEVEFLKVFDGPSVTECYERRSSVLPQQALALANNELTLRQARSLAERLSKLESDEHRIEEAFARILARFPSSTETELCAEFLTRRGQEVGASRALEHLVQVLMNHNDFLTLR